MAAEGACPSPGVLERFWLGTLDDPAAEVVDPHVAGCPACAAALGRLAPSDPLVETFRSGPSTGPPPADPPAVAAAIAWAVGLAADPLTAALPVAVGPYRVDGLLGAGGMGVVYRAVDPALGRPVAVKVLRPEVAARPGAAARFAREGRALAALAGDHVVRVYAVGEDAGRPYLAMERLDGETLAARLDRGRLPVAEAVRVGREVAAGLAAVHAAGIVHRDVKPGNVWLDRATGRAVLLDFGLALAPDRGESLTLAGGVLGTPAYMAPEQARGEPVGPRADLFSLGAVLYHALAGRPPFPGPTPAAVLTAVAVAIPPRLRRVNPAVPPALDALVARLLCKRPAGRPGSAEAVARELAAGGGRGRRPAWLVGGLAASALVMAGVVVARLPGPPPGTTDGGDEPPAWPAGRTPGDDAPTDPARPGLEPVRRRAVGPPVAAAGRPYTVTFSAAGGDLAGWTVDWGDGPAESVPPTAGAAAHTYATPGERTVRVAAAEAGGAARPADTLARNYRADFRPDTPLGGWSYRWHPPDRPAGPAGFAPLGWRPVRSAYVADPAWFPTPGPAAFANLTPAGGHPGTGSGQNGVGDAAVAAAYAAPAAGTYRLGNGTLTRTDGATGGVIELAVYAGPNRVFDRPRVEGAVSWASPPARLAAGEALLAAVGPAGDAAFDSFTWDFDVFRVGDFPVAVAADGGPGDAPAPGPFPPLAAGWVAEVAALPPAGQAEAVAAELRRRNPAFRGAVTPVLTGGAVTGLRFAPDGATDLSPVRALPKLDTLHLRTGDGPKSLTDLRPLAGLPLQELDLAGNPVADLAPLRGMPLTRLDLGYTEAADLAPLAGMRLTRLSCWGAKVADLRPLAGMPLGELHLAYCPVADLAPVKGMPLWRLWASGSRVADLTPLRGMPLRELAVEGAAVGDLSPLLDLPRLERLSCDYRADRDAAVLRKVKTLRLLNDRPAAEVLGEAKP